jgi:hypothetical protein
MDVSEFFVSHRFVFLQTVRVRAGRSFTVMSGVNLEHIRQAIRRTKLLKDARNGDFSLIEQCVYPLSASESGRGSKFEDLSQDAN